VGHFDDSEYLSPKITELVREHLKYCEEFGLPPNDPCEGRIQIANKGVIEWEMDDFYEGLDETE
jgi:hypothetical protein